jgi:hypothetical protein
MEKFSFQGQEYVITLGYYDAINVLPEKFDLHLVKLFVDQQALLKTINGLLADDEKALQLMWFYMQESASFEWDDLLKKVSSSDINTFREAFWAEVVNFSGPLKKTPLMDLWKMAKTELKKMTFDELSSDLHPEESTLAP